MYTLDSTDRHAISFMAHGSKPWEQDGHYGETAPTIRANASMTRPSVCVSFAVTNPVIYPGVGITSKVNRSNPKPGAPAPTITASSARDYVVGTLDASYYKGQGARNGAEREYIIEKSNAPTRKYIVRRLTPLECCRLQGFPDWWEDGVDGSDSARYKMWGNGVALPCVERVMYGIRKVEGQ